MRGTSPKESGFSLIELLVVVSIIAILASIAFVALSSARIKSRDSRRIQDLRQIANAVALREDNSRPIVFTGCTAAGDAAYTCAGSGPDLSAYKDPTRPTAICTSSSSAPCEYTVFTETGNVYPATSHNWKVCAYLEAGPPIRQDPGMIRIQTGGSLMIGC
ncbi:MAG: pilus assembly protein [Parcubacteria group bacterium Gr01-1014_8]|nr:MAG: pilus assembly protein [Parcubacteria group bacterium Gr01-1014_8]